MSDVANKETTCLMVSDHRCLRTSMHNVLHCLCLHLFLSIYIPQSFIVSVFYPLFQNTLEIGCYFVKITSLPLFLFSLPNISRFQPSLFECFHSFDCLFECAGACYRSFRLQVQYCLRIFIFRQIPRAVKHFQLYFISMFR